MLCEHDPVAEGVGDPATSSTSRSLINLLDLCRGRNVGNEVHGLARGSFSADSRNASRASSPARCPRSRCECRPCRDPGGNCRPAGHFEVASCRRSTADALNARHFVLADHGVFMAG
jgi:hypothetical protein